MSELSVFIDESGDFGELTERPAYYLVTLVFHDQKEDISDHVRKLEESIHNAGFDTEYIHTGPVIRREDVFASLTIDERRKLIYKMLNFTVSCPITHETVMVDRKEAPDKIALSGKLGREISKLIMKHEDFLHKYDKIIVYYDNGQRELSAILNTIFSIHFTATKKVLIGWSAAAFVFSPTLELVNGYSPEMNFLGLTDLKGIELTNVEVLPHDSKFKKRFDRFEERCSSYEEAHGIEVIGINDGEGVLICGNEVEICRV